MTTTDLRLELRPYQAEALDLVTAAEARGVRAQLGVAATGLGKTVMFAALAERRGGRTLVLAHRDELVQQAAAKVAEVWPGVDIGIVKAELNMVTSTVVVASVQTLARPARLQALLDPIENPGLLSARDPFDLVVVDEAHHAAADTYRAVLDRLRAGHPAEPIPDAPEFDVDPLPAGPLLLGVTATPDRGDGKGLDDLFGEITFSYDMLWGIRSGYLSDLRGLRVQLEQLDLSKVRTTRGDYQAGDSARALIDADAPELIVKAWQEHASDRRTLVFTPTVGMAQDVAEEFHLAGVPSAYVSGGTPMDERRQILRDYSAGLVQVLVNCAVLTEGYDEPRTDCIVVARPTKSRALYAQMVGRGTRRHPDKADCLVLDVVGATGHSLVTVPTLFGIDRPEYADRLGDGSAGAAALVDEFEQEQVRLGRMRAEDVELFAAMRAEGIAWVQIHAEGEELRRYHRPLGPDMPVVVLAQRDPDRWTAGLWWPARNGHREVKRALVHLAPMELAQGVAEDYVRKHGPHHLVRADAPWRGRKPTPKQVAAAKRLGLNPAQFSTAGELSEAMDQVISRRQARRR